MENNVAYYGLPSEVKFCKKCVISNQRPSSVVEFKNKPTDRKPTIQLNDEGVCSACVYAEMKNNIDWVEREKELITLCDKYRSRSGYYDCLVPGSGGKDSSFAAHILKYKYGMNPLTVTWAPHMYTQVGWLNLQSWIHSGLDNILFSPNGKLHRLLTKLAFENLVHPFQPFIIGQKLIAPRFSVLYDIPLIFYGDNQAEYGNNIDDNFRPTMDISFFMQTKREIKDIYLGGCSAEELINKYKVEIKDLNPYLPVGGDRIKKVGTQVHYLGYYLRWDPQECYYYASENTGFQANTERTEGSYSKYSSIDDKIDPLHYYTTYIKFGIGRATYDASQEIRNNKITREEGVTLVRKYDSEFPAKYFKEILDYMGITEERFWEVINRARSPHLWKKEEGGWKLKHQVS
ncbi:MAG TPA: N-acetyl sugar amidotransferase [Candidatus Margulisiibacteriota bacterium]|nr:N-acetyl sugar amidotransferase [Candidatus Margulisiibacteriota bacterium]